MFNRLTATILELNHDDTTGTTQEVATKRNQFVCSVLLVVYFVSSWFKSLKLPNFLGEPWRPWRFIFFSATMAGAIYPFPLSRCFPAFALFSMNSIIFPATSTPVDFSIPSRPGDEFTSITTAP